MAKSISLLRFASTVAGLPDDSKYSPYSFVPVSLKLVTVPPSVACPFA
jgi:hypothetical protein